MSYADYMDYAAFVGEDLAERERFPHEFRSPAFEASRPEQSAKRREALASVFAAIDAYWDRRAREIIGCG